MKLTYPACFYKDPDNDNYAVVVPDLPGCTSGGDDLAEAILMATDAACGWVLDELESGKSIPTASKIGDIRADTGGFVNYLVLEMDEYAEKYGSKAVRKSLTIPAWLNTYGEQRNLNFSQVLTEGLTEIYRHDTAM